MGDTKRPTMTEIIDRLGGVVATAYLTGASIQTVYTWRETDHVFQLRHALKLVKAANDAGLPLRVEQLATATEPRDGNGKPARSGSRARKRRGRDSNPR